MASAGMIAAGQPRQQRERGAAAMTAGGCMASVDSHHTIHSAGTNEPTSNVTTSKLELVIGGHFLKNFSISILTPR